MSWKTKNSRTVKVESNGSYCSSAMKDRWKNEVLPKYETRLGALMPILHDVQEAHNGIPHAAMLEIADFLKIPASDVLDCVSFYEQYHEHPTGKHVISICQSFACEACGHKAILDRIRNKLGIEPHETTRDGKFTLLALECLGACDTAPCALINDKRYDNLTPESIETVLDSLE